MLVCDLDRVVSVAGISRKEYLERRITSKLEDCIQNRKSFVSIGKSEFKPVEGMERVAAIIYPIIASSNVAGAVVLLQNENEEVPNDAENALAQVAASFIGKQMEE